MVGTFQEILDSSSGNWARIKSITDLRVLAFVGSTEAKYSSIELNLGDFFSFRLPVVGRFFIECIQAPVDKGQPPLSTQRSAAGSCPKVVLVAEETGAAFFGVRRGLCVRAALAALNRHQGAKAARTHRPRRTPNMFVTRPEVVDMRLRIPTQL